ncbi:MAG: phenylacetate--CoA ligase [Candidatus Omnitrophica bacterium]|nr:phenylacetate--CoA ligase [Candidatus Omnitrophota bacterium]MCM8776937.1 phenylacetate--CoA ligase [Candidatus Omnitrophota bacterium]
MFFQPDKENISIDNLKAVQEECLAKTIELAGRSPYYRKLFNKYGLKPKIKALKDIAKFPFTTKEDLRQSYPTGMVAVPFEEIVRMHASSGTTGKSTLVFHTKKDIENWAILVARGLYAVGVRKTDIFQNMMNYGLFTGGLGLHYGAEKLGALVIPAGSGNTKKQIELWLDLKTTVIHITPSYLFYLGHVIEEEEKIPLSKFSLKIAIVGAEPHSEETRRKLENIFGIKVFNCYGLSEMNGPGVAFECEYQNGLHLWEDHYYAEIINPDTGEVLPEGKEGELVLTTLAREGMPVIRYRTRDITKFIKGRCPCGRTHRRIERIKGRTDDMFIVKGVNIFPSQIEGVLMQIPEVDKNYRIVIDRYEGLDKLIVEVEVKKGFFDGELSHLKAIQDKLTNKLKENILVTPVVNLVEPGSLPSSTGKAQRVIDKRRL